MLEECPKPFGVFVVYLRFELLYLRQCLLGDNIYLESLRQLSNEPTKDHSMSPEMFHGKLLGVSQ